MPLVVICPTRRPTACGHLEARCCDGAKHDCSVRRYLQWRASSQLSGLLAEDGQVCRFTRNYSSQHRSSSFLMFFTNPGALSCGVWWQLSTPMVSPRMKISYFKWRPCWNIRNPNNYILTNSSDEFGKNYIWNSAVSVLRWAGSTHLHRCYSMAVEPFRPFLFYPYRQKQNRERHPLMIIFSSVLDSTVVIPFGYFGWLALFSFSVGNWKVAQPNSINKYIHPSVIPWNTFRRWIY